MTEKYSFIDAEYAEKPGDDAGEAPAIMQIRGWLGVSKSGYYDWRSRPRGASVKRGELLMLKIRALFEANTRNTGTGRRTRSRSAARANWSATWCASWAWSPASPGRGGTR